MRCIVCLNQLSQHTYSLTLHRPSAHALLTLLILPRSDVLPSISLCFQYYNIFYTTSYLLILCITFTFLSVEYSLLSRSLLCIFLIQAFITSIFIALCHRSFGLQGSSICHLHRGFALSSKPSRDCSPVVVPLQSSASFAWLSQSTIFVALSLLHDKMCISFSPARCDKRVVLFLYGLLKYNVQNHTSPIFCLSLFLRSFVSNHYYGIRPKRTIDHSGRVRRRDRHGGSHTRINEWCGVYFVVVSVKARKIVH